MQKACLKCSHVNAAATGAELEPCPRCGAIYSKVEAAMAAKPKPQEMGSSRQFWTYALLAALLVVLIPLTIYEQTWGSTAKRRLSEASLSAALDSRRTEAAEAEAKAHRDFIRLAIMEKRVEIGMTAGQVREAWGQPTSINRTVTAGSTHEQWVYRRGSAMSSYVYLDDGVVQSFQVSE